MTPEDGLNDAVERGLLPTKGTVLVAVSGGLDSVALAHAVHRAGYGWTIVIATVDHGLHDESESQAQFVGQWAANLGLEFVCLRADPDGLASGSGVEDGARQERYRLLEALADRVGAVAILTAHTADDQAETMVMRLADGAGIGGLRGIPVRRGRIVRPLLGVTRSALSEWAESERLEWVEDPTNDSTRFLRNAVRKSVRPAMAEVFGESWIRSAARTAANLADVETILTDRLSCLMDGVEWREDAILIKHTSLIEHSDPVQRLFWARLMTEEARWRFSSFARPNHEHIRALLELAKRGHQGGRRDLGSGWYAALEGPWLGVRRVVTSDESTVPVAALRIEGPGRYAFGDWTVEVGVPEAFQEGGGEHFVPLDVAPFPWSVRTIARGERFRPFGAPGRKRISKLWIDAKFPANRRATAPAIEARGVLVWVAGLRASHTAVATPGNTVVRVSCYRAAKDA